MGDPRPQARAWVLATGAWAKSLVRELEARGYEVEPVAAADLQRVQGGALLVGDLSELPTFDAPEGLRIFTLSGEGTERVRLLREDDGAIRACELVDEALFGSLRKHDRVLVRLPAIVTVGDRRWRGHTVDISRGGTAVVIRASSVPDSGEATIEATENASGETFVARGRIRWARPQRYRLRRSFRVGIEFDIEPADGPKVDEFLTAVSRFVAAYNAVQSRGSAGW